MKSVLTLLLATGLLSAALPALAATDTWTGGTSTDWGDSTNWNGTVPATGDVVEFNSTFSNQPTLAGPLGGSSNNVGLWLTTGVGQTVTLSTGANTLNLAGTTTINGNANTAILLDDTANHNLTIGSGGTTATLASTSFLVNNAGTLTVQGGLNIANGTTLTIGGTNASGNTTINGSIANTTGALTMSGSGTLTLSNASNSFTGGLNLNSGKVDISSGADLGGGSITFNGGNLVPTAGVTIGASNPITINAGGATISPSGSALVTIASNISGSGNLTLYSTSNGPFAFSGNNSNFSGNILFGSYGPSALTFSGANSTGTGTVNLSYTGTVKLLSNTSASFIASQFISNEGYTTTFDADPITSGANQTVTLNYLSNYSTSSPTYAFTSSNGYSVAITSLNINTNYGTTLDPTTAKVAIGTATSSINTTIYGLTLEGTATGNTIGSIHNGGPGGGFVTVSSGGWTIGNSAASTYTGPTKVTGGTLIVSGSLTSTASVSVSTGTLEILNSNNAISSSAHVTLTAGTLEAVSNESESLSDLILGAGVSTLALGNTASVFKFANSSADTWSGTLDVSDWNGASTGGGSDELFFGTAATALTSAQLSDITFINGTVDGTPFATDTAVQLSDGEIVATALAIPEPGTWAMMLSGAGMLIFWQRRRRQRQ